MKKEKESIQTNDESIEIKTLCKIKDGNYFFIIHQFELKKAGLNCDAMAFKPITKGLQKIYLIIDPSMTNALDCMEFVKNCFRNKKHIYLKEANSNMILIKQEKGN